MRTLILLLGTACALTVPATAHAVEDGPAFVELPQCSTGTPVSETRVTDCSYIALPGRDGKVYYGYLSSAGQVTWGGTSTGGVLGFPADAQQWPALAPLFSGIGLARLIPGPISGITTDAGAAQFTMTFNAKVEALGSQCTATGTVTISTEATDSVGGAVGAPISGGRFGAAGTSTSPPILTGSACAQATSYLDLSRGVGVYAAGVLTLGGTSTGASAGAQTATFDAPKRIARKGSTVILRRTVMTNAGQRATATLSWSTKKSANGSSPRFASSRMTRSGKLTLKTTGSAKRLYVRLTVTAPATPGFQELLVSRKWVVR